MIVFFHPRKKDIVLQMDLFVQILFKVLQHCVRNAISIAGICRRKVIVGQDPDLPEPSAFVFMVISPGFNFIRDQLGRIGQMVSCRIGHVFKPGNTREQNLLFLFKVRHQIIGATFKKRFDFKQFRMLTAVGLAQSVELVEDGRDFRPHITVVFFEDVIDHQIERPGIKIDGVGVCREDDLGKLFNELAVIDGFLLADVFNRAMSATAVVDAVFVKDRCCPEIVGYEFSDG